MRGLAGPHKNIAISSVRVLGITEGNKTGRRRVKPARRPAQELERIVFLRAVRADKSEIGN